MMVLVFARVTMCIYLSCWFLSLYFIFALFFNVNESIMIRNEKGHM